MTNSGGKIYEKKSFTREEWNDQIAGSTMPMLGDLYNNGRGTGFVSNATSNGTDNISARTSVEPSIPKLLLNYFVCMAYEESSIRMARELGYVKSNKDVKEFNDLYKIRERAHISELIKKGKVSDAMEEINTIFGIEVLECGDMGASSNGDRISDASVRNYRASSNSKEDLHFKLLLLNLIEMIRTHDQECSKLGRRDDSDEFILKLIEYSQEKLALKAASNKSYMTDLELVMTLLLFPMTENANVRLPKSLKNLYSLSLRSNIANLVNRKLLRNIHPQVANESMKNGKYPDLIGSNDGITGKQFSHYNEMLMVRPKEDIAQNLTTESLAELRDNPEGILRSSVTSVSEDWSRTAEMIKEQQQQRVKEKQQGGKNSDQVSDMGNPSPDDFDVSEYQYEAKLVQVMKLWAWCENQLHNNDIGVPRVEGSI